MNTVLPLWENAEQGYQMGLSASWIENVSTTAVVVSAVPAAKTDTVLQISIVPTNICLLLKMSVQDSVIVFVCFPLSVGVNALFVPGLLHVRNNKMFLIVVI